MNAARDDSGFSLVELLIAMMIFSIFLIILVSTLSGIQRASTKVSVVAQTSNGMLNVFSKFDRQVRYADSVNFPGVGASGARYVEFRVPAASSPSGVTTCTQWKYDPVSMSLQSRTWPEAANATPTAWFTVLPNMASLAIATYPFELKPADSLFKNQRLILTISGGQSATQGASASTTFVARNSLIGSPSNGQTKKAGVSDTPVCWSSLVAGARP
jgi:prepilin-type N-terminal cleavage/methylation domain-containing protein